jgi:hypothetical protein
MDKKKNKNAEGRVIMSVLSKAIRRALAGKDPEGDIKIGDIFGDLEVLGIGEKKGTSRHIHYVCLCRACGKEVTVPSYRLKSGASKSCGCSRTKHGHTSRIFKGGTEVYRRFVEMHRRCEEKTHRGYERYGARGIKVCDRWSGDKGFENFFADMGPCPEGYQLDRINGKLGYSPENCRYVDLKTQNRNRIDNVWLEYKGERLILHDWGEKRVVSGSFIQRRLSKGLSMREIEELCELKRNLGK